MKILLLHVDWIEWEPTKKALKQMPDVEKIKHRIEDALVVLTAVEKPDENNPEEAALKLVGEIKDVAKQLKAEKVVLYPYAHLSKNLGSPSVSIQIFDLAEKTLKKDFFVERAEFGWYKKLAFSAKGHPLSELSREIVLGDTEKSGQVSEALKKEETLVSEWFILDTQGKQHKIGLKDKKIEGFDFSKWKKLEKFVMYELAKNRNVDKEPPHISLMKKLQLVGYEEGSDPGNLRFLPKGRLIKSLLEEWVTKKTIEYGAAEVETPIMYDVEHPTLKSYLNRFPARQYNIQTPNKKVFLRFAACFGQFLIAKDASISYKNLPLPFYELTRYSFRVEQRGELAGLRRLRAFTMPDCHCLVKDFKQAKTELMKRVELAQQVHEGIGFNLKEDFEYAIRVTKDFFDEHKDFLVDLVKKWEKPILLEVWDKRFFYFVFKYEFNFVDALDKAATLSTDQIDIENAERYGIKYTDSDNTQKYPLILHLSPSGAIERVMYALLERAGMEQENKKHPILPLWLSPTQVRLCPVNDSFIKDCENIANKMPNIRVDIDDNLDSIQKKIRNSELEWVPLTVVLGEKEKTSGKLSVRIRETGEVKQMTEKEVIDFVINGTKGMPFKPLSLPKLLSKRAIFVA